MNADLRALAERLLTHDINNSAYDLAFRIANEDAVLVPKLLVANNKLIEQVGKDYVFGSCFLFANKPTHYQVPFYRALEKLDSTTVLWPRQSGKTQSFGIGSNLVALTRRNAQILVISASMRQSLILRRKMNKPLNQMHPSLRRLLYDEILKTTVTTKSGSLIAFESCLSEDNIRGYSADLIIGDEVAMWPNAEYLYSDVLDPMFNATDGAFVAGSTPKTKTGLFYTMCQDTSFVHLHATWLDAIEAGIMSITRANKINQNALEGKITIAGMFTEYWARFFDDEGRLLSYDALLRCTSHDNNYVYYSDAMIDRLAMAAASGAPPLGSNWFVGTDLGQIGDNCVIVLVEKVDNYYAIRHIKVFALDTPYDQYIKYHEKLAKVFALKGGYVDGTNNTYLAEQISRVMRGKVAKLSTPFRAETARILRERVTGRELVIPQDKDKFVSALNSINRDSLDTDTQAQHSGNSDQFWACGLAVRAGFEHKHGIIAK